MNCKIREAVSDDLSDIFMIEQSASQNPWTREHLTTALADDNTIFLVAETVSNNADVIFDDDDITNVLTDNAADKIDNKTDNVCASTKIAAFACAAVIVDELQIGEIAVDKNYQNKGIGTILIKHLLANAAARGAAFATLEVRSSNHRAIRLYEKNGFTKNGVRPRYYQDGEDAVLYALYF